MCKITMFKLITKYLFMCPLSVMFISVNEKLTKVLDFLLICQVWLCSLLCHFGTCPSVLFLSFLMFLAVWNLYT